jgi:dGTP triphosphohydrolase
LLLGVDQRTERRNIVIDFIRDRLEHSIEIDQVMFHFVEVLAEKVHQVDYGIVICSFDN